MWHEQVQIAFVYSCFVSTILIFNLLNFKTQGSCKACFAHLRFCLAKSFDNMWSSIELVINSDDTWRQLSKTFDI